MSMQKYLTIKDNNCRSITALGYHPARREILTGGSDGSIKWWDLDSGRLSSSSSEHEGMITQFLYWTDVKLLLSASNDGTLVVWTVGATVLEKIMLRRPIFSIAINHRRQQLVCGFKGRLTVYPLDQKRTTGKVINVKESHSNNTHRDIVSCIICHDSQIYSCGYDRKFIIFHTSSYSKGKNLVVVNCNSSAHDAGITTLIMVKEKESTRFLTGSFDKTVHVWSQDGQVIQKLTFSGVINGLCYIPCVNLVWISSGLPTVSIYDPKSGEIVSEFIDIINSSENGPNLERLMYLSEISYVVGSAGQCHMMVWRYNKAGSATVLTNQQPVECLAYTIKTPILLFSGHSDGTFAKWEQIKSSEFLYSQESFSLHESIHKGEEMTNGSTSERIIDSPELKRRIMFAKKYKEESEKNMILIQGDNVAGYIRSVFIEELDILALSSENGSIQLWGFDDLLSSISHTVPSQMKTGSGTRKKLKIQLNTSNELKQSDANGKDHISDSFSSRLSGIVCKKLLTGHFHSVSGLAVIKNKALYSTIYLVSGGWDRRLCIWDVKAGKLQDTFCNPDLEKWHELKEVACDGAILDLAYAPKRNEIAYSSSDGMIYMRQFSPVGKEMKLVNVLQGHESDVTSIVWHSLIDKWISGSEDGTIRIWSEDGMQCEHVLETNGAVSCLNFDTVNGCIMAGVHNVLRVYDARTLLEVQRNVGHKDSIRSVIHITERNQYITASSDKTIRIWKSHHKLPT
ncbi:vegetative incompatibility protein HET-E-1-like [Polypterus senegalus]|uniref:vegetative incompatibility protein HET-E-1-like n=1 Tax=Polypterus senegalus TaxID=55291 RepID=UPI0019629D51|nr:vegetative incompatibility protein HET-E-1-like [Polypterus senegalus]XP_039630577.1 vegetative incompatibility protein HET-E-1-like [Polypterus senegalus]XP_039630578.1 vegetative incompatibility protein HET-E-1-like [Polypterus senegalus]XP_039630580.1 vegetative incompatibility protein HET-E-1-like [Polypterus senegalus]